MSSSVTLDNRKLRIGEEWGIRIGEEWGIRIGKEWGIRIGEEWGIRIGEEWGIRIGEEWGIRNAWLNTECIHVFYYIPILNIIFKRFFPLESLYNGDLLLLYFRTQLASSTAILLRQCKIPGSLCMVTNLSGFYVVYFLFSCFWGERGEEMEKDPVLFSILHYLGLG